MFKKYRTAIFSLIGVALILVSSVTPAVAATRVPEADYTGPEGSYSFKVEIEGVDIGRVASVEGLGISQEVIEYQNGDDPLTRKRPGRVTYGNITITKAYLASSTLNDWIEMARFGNNDYTRKNMSIILYDNRNNELKRWNCSQCFPESWNLYSIESKGNDVLMEEIVIAIEYFEEA